jgi:hypothetical protein
MGLTGEKDRHSDTHLSPRLLGAEVGGLWPRQKCETVRFENQLKGKDLEQDPEFSSQYCEGKT